MRRFTSTLTRHPPPHTALIQSLNMSRSVLSDATHLLSLLPPPTQQESYTAVCPVLGASLGGHLRHLHWHLQVAVRPLLLVGGGGPLNYDERIRRSPIEVDFRDAVREVGELDFQLLGIIERVGRKAGAEEEEGGEDLQAVTVSFNMSSSPNSTAYQSTAPREVAFAAHHGLHHLAMMKIIAEGVGGVEKGKLGGGFGKAPSTVLFEGEG